MQYLPYGLWKSKIDPKMVTQRGRICSLKWDLTSDEDVLYFSTSKGGKSSIYKKEKNQPVRQINGDQPIYGSVGYGGGDFAIHGNRLIGCHGDQGLVQLCGNQFQKLTTGGMDHADPCLSPDGKFVAYVCSDGINDQIALLELGEYSWPRRWIKGADFYMQPEWSPNEEMFAWTEWNHPNMPWSGSTVKYATLDKETKDIQTLHIAGGGCDAPASQPHFSPDGSKMAFIEASGDWEDLVIIDLASGQRSIAIHGEGFALSDTTLAQGYCSYAWLKGAAQIVYTRIIGSRSEMWLKDLASGIDKLISPEGLTSFEQVCISPNGTIAVIAAGPLSFSQVLLIRSDTTETVFNISEEHLSQEFVSLPEDIQWQSESGETIHALYYAPCNPDYTWHGAPPAIVQIHGGPTGKADQTFSSETAYFTSLGYAYVRLNYRGSSGYGRTYLESLNGHWGEYDTQDAVTCARYLINQGLADANKLLITGGSAGGFVVLNTLEQYPDVYSAGACLYGVSDLFGIVADSLKIEMHYTDSLVGTLPDAEEKFYAWSPLYHAERIKVPLAVFQGSKDPVVPQYQSENLLNKLCVPHVYRLYEGEGHGFRQPEHIQDYLETLTNFLVKYLS